MATGMINYEEKLRLTQVGLLTGGGRFSLSVASLHLAKERIYEGSRFFRDYSDGFGCPAKPIGVLLFLTPCLLHTTNIR